jgi:hypothetical protein
MSARAETRHRGRPSNPQQVPEESRSYYSADEKLTYFNRHLGWSTPGEGTGVFDEYRGRAGAAGADPVAAAEHLRVSLRAVRAADGVGRRPGALRDPQQWEGGDRDLKFIVPGIQADQTLHSLAHSQKTPGSRSRSLTLASEENAGAAMESNRKERQDLHELVDQLPEGHALAARRYLEDLRDRVLPGLAQLLAAEEEDAAPTSG